MNKKERLEILRRKIKEGRKRKRWTQEFLAYKLGCYVPQKISELVSN